MDTIKLILKSIVIFIFVFVNTYVLLFGKKETGIKMDCFFTDLFLIMILWRLS